MGSGHIIYIPLILFLGMALGFALARQGAARQVADAERRRRLREERAGRLKEELLAQPPSGNGTDGDEPRR